MFRVSGVPPFKILAIDPDYWGLGLDALMFVKIIEAFDRRGYQWMDGSLTGGDNPFSKKSPLALALRSTSAIGCIDCLSGRELDDVRVEHYSFLIKGLNLDTLSPHLK